MSKIGQHTTTHPAGAIELVELFTIEARKQNHPSIPVMLWGQPGVGKSAIIKQIAEKHDRPVIDIRLLLNDPTDLKGLPYFDTNRGTLEVAKPVDFPDADRPEHAHLLNAIIILDELASAPQAVQAAALQLILDRKVGTYTLPEDVIVVAAGNRATDGSVFEEMPTPLRNRFAHIDVEANFQQWKNWATLDADIHPLVMGYLESMPSSFNKFEPRSMDGVYAFATPRSWERVSDALWLMTDKDTLAIKDQYRLLFKRVIGSLVGVAVAEELAAYNETYGMIPLPNDIVDGKVKSFDYSALENRQQQSARYATVLAVTHVLSERWKQVGDDPSKREKFYNEYCKNFVDYFTMSMSKEKEFIAIACEMLIRREVHVHAYDGFKPFVMSISSIINEI